MTVRHVFIFLLDATAAIKEVFQRVVVPEMKRKKEEFGGELTLKDLLDEYDDVNEGTRKDYYQTAAKLVAVELNIQVGP